MTKRHGVYNTTMVEHWTKAGLRWLEGVLDPDPCISYFCWCEAIGCFGQAWLHGFGAL